MEERRIKTEIEKIYELGVKNGIEIGRSVGKEKELPSNAQIVQFYTTEEKLPNKFERVLNQDGEPVFLDSADNWKSIIEKKQTSVKLWCYIPRFKGSE